MKTAILTSYGYFSSSTQVEYPLNCWKKDFPMTSDDGCSGFMAQEHLRPYPMTSVRLPPAQEGLAFSLTWRMQLHYLTLTANEWRTQKMFCKFYAKTYVTTWYLAPCNVSFRLRGRYNRHMRSHRPHNHETEIQERYSEHKDKAKYGKDTVIAKEECINHVAKRLGTALRGKVKE
ncbi:hypothetical protein JTE90_003434 [Oedothorax gibbosus]|uniref:Uncharacterized protein n=1 Tax=Oedothorax gibbosus TaxID=931172 RepID=A0AAV6TZL6_9ARAC|nr:hypothetical protein JTE90_003434 [Oedothorax gibbosus]